MILIKLQNTLGQKKILLFTAQNCSFNNMKACLQKQKRHFTLSMAFFLAFLKLSYL